MNRLRLVIFMCCCISLSACGVRPSEVDPPVGSENTAFPGTYPDPGTDPGPYSPVEETEHEEPSDPYFLTKD